MQTRRCEQQETVTRSLMDGEATVSAPTASTWPALMMTAIGSNSRRRLNKYTGCFGIFQQSHSIQALYNSPTDEYLLTAGARHAGGAWSWSDSGRVLDSRLAQLLVDRMSSRRDDDILVVHYSANDRRAHLSVLCIRYSHSKR